MVALDNLSHAFRNVRIRHFFRPFWRAPSERAYDVRRYLEVCLNQCPEERQHGVKRGTGSKGRVSDVINILQYFALDFRERGLRRELQEQREK